MEDAKVGDAVPARAHSTMLSPLPVYDHVGVGFGPANLGLCIALHESQEARARDFQMCFLEKEPQFAWHPSLLLPGAQLQVSPMKDLATMRDPTSAYTFFNFLHTEGRLMQYINREEKVPSRREWSAYLAWAARHMAAYVRYAHEVTDIVPVQRDGQCLYRLQCATPSGARDMYARNVSIAVGGAARVPPPFTPLYTPRARGSRVVHSSTFLPQMASLEPMLQRAALDGASLRLAVVGGGQSSAEMLRYLRERFPMAALDFVLRASALVPSDDTPFVNSAAFDPVSVSTFWESSVRQREAQLAEFKRTNYSVIRSDLLAELYEMIYDQEIGYLEPGETPKGLVRVLASTLVHAVDVCDDGRLRVATHTVAGERATRTETYDAVFLGTGFLRDPSTLPFVRTLAEHFPLLSPDGASCLRREELAHDEDDVADREAHRAALRGITRDYRLVPRGTAAEAIQPLAPSVMERIPLSRVGREGLPGHCLARVDGGGTADPPAGRGMSGAVYVFGSNERTHGLSDSLMSMVAHRAAIVSASLLVAPAH